MSNRHKAMRPSGSTVRTVERIGRLIEQDRRKARRSSRNALSTVTIKLAKRGVT
jgi:hypothetical protein